MAGETGQSVVIPGLKVYNARRNEDILLKNVRVDADYVCDSQGRVIYFDLNEAKAYLQKQGKSLPSLPLLVNIWIALDGLAKQDEAAAQLFHQLNTGWDRTATSVTTAGSVLHSDIVLGEIGYEGLKMPEQGGDLIEFFGKYRQLFQALLGLRDIESLADLANRQDLVPFYWSPKGERLAMFGGGDFYYMHQHVPGLLMVFCDDLPYPRRIARGVWPGDR